MTEKVQQVKPEIGDLVKINLTPPMDLTGEDLNNHILGKVENVNGNEISVRVRAGYIWNVYPNELQIITRISGKTTTRLAVSRERIREAVRKAKTDRTDLL